MHQLSCKISVPILFFLFMFAALLNTGLSYLDTCRDQNIRITLKFGMVFQMDVLGGPGFLLFLWNPSAAS